LTDELTVDYLDRISLIRSILIDFDRRWRRATRVLGDTHTHKMAW